MVYRLLEAKPHQLSEDEHENQRSMHITGHEQSVSDEHDWWGISLFRKMASGKNVVSHGSAWPWNQMMVSTGFGPRRR